MKIVVLDGYTLNPGDVSWEGLEKIGDLTVYDRTVKKPTEIITAIGTAEVIFTNKTPLSKEVLEQVPSVKYVGVLATGYNIVDTDAAKSLGITVPTSRLMGPQPLHSLPSRSLSNYAIMWETTARQLKTGIGVTVPIFVSGIHR